jgi:2-hydroxycyclohexanecarboxyl-CoA dehydrogenase
MRKGIAAEHLDLADPASIEAFAREVGERVGATDVLVNAAGWDRIEPFMDNSDEFIRDIVAINYLGPVRLSKALLPPMIDGGAGATIVNVASDAGRVGSTARRSTPGRRAGSSPSPSRWPGRWPGTRSRSTACVPARPTLRCSTPSPTG